MSTPMTKIDGYIAEGSDYTYAPTEPLLYADGTPVVEGHIDTFTVTIVDQATGTILRDAVSVLDGGGAISSEGMLTWPVTSQDTRSLSVGPYQARRMTFQLLTAADIHLNWGVLFTVYNFPDIG